MRNKKDFIYNLMTLPALSRVTDWITDMVLHWAECEALVVKITDARGLVLTLESTDKVRDELKKRAGQSPLAILDLMQIELRLGFHAGKSCEERIAQMGGYLDEKTKQIDLGAWDGFVKRVVVKGTGEDESTEH